MSLTNDIFSALKEFDDYRREQREEFLSYKKNREQYKGSAGYSEEIRKASEKRERAVADARKAASTKINTCLIQMRENVEKMPIKAPTPEMTSILTVLSMKNTITREELDRASMAMQGNALALSCLADIADKHGVHHKNYDLMSDELTKEALEKHIGNVTSRCKSIFETGVKRSAFIGAENQKNRGIEIDLDSLPQSEPLTTENDFYNSILGDSKALDSFYRAVNG